ncbi:MAG TPA: NAD-dependent epimerase/dehydratase family protein [Pseudonocardiaceae bacterium]|jgi:dTDP-L-rhamnose 4-epimerase|nr:NAD-dependent epimerase/dehydratase family protein [Pseudonocardiaceae bacterium]
MRVLITGMAGFIGSHIADVMVERGHEVVGLDALLPKAHGDAGAPEWTRRHRLVTGDVRDPEVLAELLAGVDVVCHQAAVVGHGVDPSDAPSYAEHNDVGTAVLLAAMHTAGLRRLVLASSMVVYGEGRYACVEHGIVRPGMRRECDIDAGNFEPPCPVCGAPLEPRLVPEDAPLEPRSSYAASKVAQEHYAAAWARQTGGSVWALRYHNVYGARMPRDTPYAGVASLFRSALQRGAAPLVLEDGRQRRDFVHVTDVARINALAAENLVAASATQATAEPATAEPAATRTAATKSVTGAATAPAVTGPANADTATGGPGAGMLVAVNVCSGVPHTVGDLAVELAKACDGPAPMIVGGARPTDVRHVVADPARARELLGFTAQVGFADGIAAFATDPLRDPALVS